MFCFGVLLENTKTHSSDALVQCAKDAIINNFTVKLFRSGYSREQAHRIVTAGLKGYEKLLHRQQTGTANIHRSSRTGVAAKLRRKLLSKTKWFKHSRQQKDSQEEVPQLCTGKQARQRRGAGKTTRVTTRQEEIKTTTVLFVDQTPGGQLAKRMREAEVQLAAITGFRVKIVEKNGTTAKQLLHKPNPWAEGMCGRPDCYPCKTGDVKDCFRRNILYSHQCKKCKDDGIEKVYIGESSRSAKERAGEHDQDYKKRKQDSHRLKHVETDHPGQDPPEFEFRVLATFHSALARQRSEAVLIRRKGEGAVLNSKGVFNRCKLPRLTVEDYDKEERPGGQRSDPAEEPHSQHRVSGKKRREAGSRSSLPKRIRMDPQTLTADNPRQSGLAKRMFPETRVEFERECKKMRPEFDPEYESNLPLQPESLILQQKPISFFSIFTKNNRELNPNAVFKPQHNSNSKTKNQKRKTKSRKSQSDNPATSRNIISMFRNQQLRKGREGQESDRKLGD